MVTFVGMGDDGKPRFSYSDGGIDPESMHRFVKYPFIKRGNAYRFIGTPEWIKNKTEEYYKLYPTKKFLDGGILEEGDNAITAEEPEIYNDDVEEFKKGGKTIKHWKKPDNWTDDKIPYEEWVKDVNPYFLNKNYDLKSAYENYPKEQLEKWKWSTN